jgi:hypothetical protein
MALLPGDTARLSPQDEDLVSACSYMLAASPGNCNADTTRQLLTVIRKHFPKVKRTK